MHLGVGGDGNLEVCDAPQAGDQRRCVLIAVRMRFVVLHLRRGIAPQGDDVADALIPEPARQPVDLVARGADAG